VAKSFLPRFFKKAQNLYVTVVSPGNPAFSSLFTSQGSISDTQLIANFETIPQLFTITDYLASKISDIPIKVVKKSGREAPNSPLWDLVNSPNNYQSFKELVKLFFAYYEPLGNSYLYGIKPDGLDVVTSLYCLPVEKTQIILKSDKTVPAWMNEVTGYQVTIANRVFTLPADMVMHSRYVSLRYDDGSWVYGMSKYIPADTINNELKAIHDAKLSVISQRGAVGFITNESEMPDREQTQSVKDKLNYQYGIGTDQDKFIVTTEKLKWQQMAMGIQELQLIENAKYSFETLCQLSGFDPVVFSTVSTAYANKNLALKDLMSKVIKPKVDSFYDDLAMFLGEGYGGDKIVADWSKVEELQEDRKELTDVLTKQIQFGIITPKKAYEELYGEVTDGEQEPPDEYFMASSLKPIGQDPGNDTQAGTNALENEPITPDMVRQLIAEQQQNGN
jgi:HK97 family phage portal protein